ncbi:peptidoglycan DD-metalloendopeptidase family protein [Actibacterium sp. 188UL27-1]|uniref:peptidoglycan DD-metalloendopeptidase family protein n=1 Tax=Actibacterium sp. 188UL27-1 TaxID=2786961 RepID=UPI0019592F53|nr:peptidoglycan DD-metalloendopeptidase family protein [Actibacterium sp. 188UL27-1]MBM7068850.1 M23 family metallopeptidase [Actibacterium sp. 188UL27-1]
MMDDFDPWKPIEKQPAQTARAKKTRGEGNGVPWGIILGITIPVFVIAGIGTFIAATWDQWSFGSGTPVVEVSEEELDFELAAIERDAQAASSAFAAAFADLAGDPLIISFGTDGVATSATKFPRPAALVDPTRIAPTLVKVSDVMVSREERFITTLPSSQEDFAFFKAQKVGVGSAEDVLDTVVASSSADAQLIDDDGGWGDTVEDSDQDLEFNKTRVENNTSVAYVRGESQRTDLSRDIFVKISSKQSLEILMLSKGFSKAAAEAAQRRTADLMGIEELALGSVVALRGLPEPDGRMNLAQLSIYSVDQFHDSIAIDQAGALGISADPWLDQDLFDYTEDQVEVAAQEQKYRMLDAFYSTGIRNRMPATVVGEAIALLSKSHDLNAFANPGDRMTVIYGADRIEEETGAGQLLYIAVKGPSVDIECFVFRANDGNYGCFGATPDSGGGGGAVSGMVTPVKGVLTSRFGPRNHPILKTVRMHSGVDWAAPTGTPVAAAFDGTVSYAGPGGGYGNLIKITHQGGFETRYAHLHKFVAKQGDRVKAGDIVGQVGTTGRSTGPHLHFELHVAGKAIDPLASATALVAPSTGASGAVEQLVNQIIKVESAGNTYAKNPLSTATGLGQFIESTWIRMMKTYRPDLVASLNRADLLRLRTDPTISREMVKNLAREGESYLRARGHAITAGRLYLCHFLGAQGAHTVLSSRDEQTLLEVLGPGVIRANPFLRGKNVAYVKAWAERKMAGRRGGVVAALPSTPIVREPAGLPEFRKEIRALLTAG